VTRLRLYEELRVNHIASQALRPQALGFKIYSNWPGPLYLLGVRASGNLANSIHCGETSRNFSNMPCSLNDPPPLESHLRPRDSTSTRPEPTFVFYSYGNLHLLIWIPSLRSRLSGDFLLLCYEFSSRFAPSPIIQLSSASRHSFISALQ